jgi:hypothetical protein
LDCGGLTPLFKFCSRAYREKHSTPSHHDWRRQAAALQSGVKPPHSKIKSSRRTPKSSQAAALQSGVKPPHSKIKLSKTTA